MTLRFRKQMAPSSALPQFLLRVRIMVRGFRSVIPNLQRIGDVLAARLRWIGEQVIVTSVGPHSAAPAHF
jgi:hypothetical protein